MYTSTVHPSYPIKTGSSLSPSLSPLRLDPPGQHHEKPASEPQVPGGAERGEAGARGQGVASPALRPADARSTGRRVRG